MNKSGVPSHVIANSYPSSWPFRGLRYFKGGGAYGRYERRLVRAIIEKKIGANKGFDALSAGVLSVIRALTNRTF